MMKSKKQGQYNVNFPRDTTYVRLLRKSSKLIGFLPIFERSEPLFRAVSFAYFVFVDFTLLHMTILCVGDLITNWEGDLTRATETTIHIMTYGCACFIVVWIQSTNHRMYNLFKYAETELRYRSARGISVVTSAASVYSGYYLIRIVVISTIITVGHWTIDPFISRLLSKSERLEMPLGGWYPIDVESSPRYEIAFYLQILAEFYLMTFYSHISALILTISMVIRGEYAVLSSSVRNVCFTGALRSGVTYSRLAELDRSLQHDQHAADGVEIIDCKYDSFGGEEILVNEESTNDSDHLVQFTKECGIDFLPYESAILEAIADCVRHERVIRRYFDMQQECLFTPLFAFIYLLVVQITVSFYTTATKFQLKTFEMMTCGMIHLYMLCISGTMMEHESTRAAAAGWEAWGTGVGAGRRVATSIQLVMLQAARPVTLNAGPLFKLNLANFLTALKVVFSVFSLLRNVADKTDNN